MENNEGEASKCVPSSSNAILSATAQRILQSLERHSSTALPGNKIPPPAPIPFSPLSTVNWHSFNYNPHFSSLCSEVRLVILLIWLLTIVIRNSKDGLPFNHHQLHPSFRNLPSFVTALKSMTMKMSLVAKTILLPSQGHQYLKFLPDHHRP